MRSCEIGDGFLLMQSELNADMSLVDARVRGAETMSNVTSTGHVVLADTDFLGAVDLSRIICKSITLDRSRFHSSFGMQSCQFSEGSSAVGARFSGNVSIRDCVAAGELVSIDGMSVDGAISMTVSARKLSCRATRFVGGGRIDLAGPVMIQMSQATASTPLVLSSTDPSAPAELLSLRDTDTAGLVLSNIRLARCQFRGAINLDKLRTEGTELFLRAPRCLRFLGLGRITVAEEHQWRLTDGRSRRQTGWTDIAPSFPSEWRSEVTDYPPTAANVAGAYRNLRKGREDSKDEPGAADFYYGEMLMRMQPSGKPAERLIVVLYWLVSGFGLRASRAFLALFVAIAVASTLLYFYGLAPGGSHSVSQALLVALNAPFGRDYNTMLTTPGQFIQLTARIVEPILLGLALLAIRGRVKRN